MPPVDGSALPASLIDRFGGDAKERLVALLRFLGPVTGGAGDARFLTGAADPQRMPVAGDPARRLRVGAR